MSAPLEGLLRPPVELYSGAVALSAAVILYKAPTLFMMTETVSYGASAALVGFAGKRLWEGWKVKKYHKRLKRLPYYGITQGKLPITGEHLWIGRGFLWTQKHTQRYADTINPDMKKFVDDSWLFKAARRHEIAHPDSPVSKLTRIDSIFNPLRPLPPIGGNRVLHAVGVDEEKDVYMSERAGNTLVLGQSRVGKTILACNLLSIDIMRKKAPGPVIFFDPKSDSKALTTMYQAAVKAGREKDFYVFHLGFPELSCRYNAVGNFSRITEVATRIANQLSTDGNSQAFTQFAWRFTNVVARALVDLGERPDYSNILKYVTDIEPLFRQYAEWWLPRHADSTWQADVNDLEKKWANTYDKQPRLIKYQSPRTEALREYIERMGAGDGVMHGILGSLRYDRSFYEKLVASLIPALEKYTGAIQKILSPVANDLNDDRPMLDWTQVIRKNAIVYIGLDALTDQQVSSAVANSMLSDLVSTIGSIYSHGVDHGMLDGKAGRKQNIYCHIDEAGELIGEEFLPMVNKASGGGLVLTAYSQSRSDIEAAYGNAAKARVIESNFLNLIMLRVREKYTAEYLCDQLPEVETKTNMLVSGATDSSNIDNEQDFTSKTEDRLSVVKTPLITPSMVMSLPKGQAFALFNGGELYKLRIPWPEDDEAPVAESIRKMADEMKLNYKTSEGWWVQ